MQYFERKLAGGMALEDSFRRAMNRVRYAQGGHVTQARPLVAHVTTTDISLELLLGPQLEAFAAAGLRRRRGLRAGAVRRRARRARHPARPAPARDAVDRARRRTPQAVAELVAVFRRLRPDDRAHAQPEARASTAASRRASRACRSSSTPCTACTRSRTIRSPKRAAVYAIERLAAFCSRRRARAEPRGPRDARAPRCAAAQADAARQRHRPHALRSGRPSRPTTCARRGPSSARAVRDDVVVGLVGRLVREKGYAEVFEAARELRERVPHLRFAVIGGDDDEKDDALDDDDRARAAEARRALPRRRAPTCRGSTRRWTSTCWRRTARASRGRRWRPPRWACPWS